MAGMCVRASRAHTCRPRRTPPWPPRPVSTWRRREPASSPRSRRPETDTSTRTSPTSSTTGASPATIPMRAVLDDRLASYWATTLAELLGPTMPGVPRMASDVETDAARNRWTVAALNATSHRVHLPRRVRPNAATASLCGGRAASRTRTRWPAIDVSPRGTTNRPPLA